MIRHVFKVAAGVRRSPPHMSAPALIVGKLSAMTKIHGGHRGGATPYYQSSGGVVQGRRIG